MNLLWWNPASWVAVPVVNTARAIRGLFPWTQDGRRTSLHVAALGAGPALCAMTIWAMQTSLAHNLFEAFTNLSYTVAASLFVIVCAIGVGTGLNIFVKAGKDGAQFGAGGDDNDAIVEAAHQVADAGQAKATEIEEAVKAEPKTTLDLEGAALDAKLVEELKREQEGEQK